MKAKKIYFFIGTTAELIKLSPVIRTLQKRKIEFKIVASNQNTLRFSDLKLILGNAKADYTFKMKPFKWPKNVYARFVIWLIKSIGNYVIYFRNEFKGVKKKDAIFIVHGDTMTAVIGALVAKICGVTLVHIESGLRSFNMLEPFPEEICRLIISFLADIHFPPNKWAVNNLKNRGGVKVNTISNTIGEATELALRSRTSSIPGVRGKKYFVLVMHRQEHTLFHKEKTQTVIEEILSYTSSELKCVFVMHHLTKDYLAKKKKVLSRIKKNKNVILPERLSYLKFVSLINKSEFIATDGGSNQEEAYYMRKPCLILRGSTERIEGLGENAVLANNDLAVISSFIKSYKKYKTKRPKIKVAPSKIIVDYLT